MCAVVLERDEKGGGWRQRRLRLVQLRLKSLREELQRKRVPGVVLAAIEKKIESLEDLERTLQSESDGEGT